MRYRWLIENRISVRQFQNTQVDRTKLLQLMNYSEEIEGLVEGINTQFIFITDGVQKRDILEGNAGYDGHLIYAPHYIAILSDEKPLYLQNAGYMMEELLLKATELDLGTCWLTVEDGESLKKQLEMKATGRLVALAAIGYPKTRIPFTPKSTSTRIPLEKFVYFKKWGEIPSTEHLELRGLINVLYHTRMAPSWKNQQPWKLLIDGSEIILVVGGNTIPEKSLLLDSGIMMLYLQRIFNEAGFTVKWIPYDNKKNYHSKYNIPKEYQIIGSLNI